MALLKISRDSVKRIRQLAGATGLTEKQVFDDLLLIGFRAADQLYGQLIQFRKELNVVGDTGKIPQDAGHGPNIIETEEPELPLPEQPDPEPDEEAVALGVSEDEEGHFIGSDDDALGSRLAEDEQGDTLFASQDRGE